MYKKIMNRKAKSIIVWMLVAVMQLTSILPMATVYAGNEIGVGVGSDGKTTPAAIEMNSDVVQLGAITKVIAKDEKDGTELKDITNYHPEMGDEISLRFQFELEDKHNYGKGSTLTYPLPTPLKPASGNGTLANSDGDQYATYTIDKDNVIITFNENIRSIPTEDSGGTVGLKTNGWFRIQAKYEADKDNNGLEHILKLPGSDDVVINFQPRGGKEIVKTFQQEKPDGKNSTFVTWTVLVNTVMNDLGSGSDISFTDELTGNHEYDETSLRVERFEVGADGDLEESISKAVNVTDDFINQFKEKFTTEKKEFGLSLTGKYAYKIQYKTLPGDTEEKGQTLGNEADFKGNPANASTTITYGDPLAKTV